MDTTAVILAVASPPGWSLRGIVRASGAACFELLWPSLRSPTRDRGVSPARLRADGLDVACLALVFPGPRSYTGEDSAEIQLPGNPALLERVIEALLQSGRVRGIDARRAEAGEFSARAFLNGRMSLTAAEGVAATIAARSDAQLRAARLLAGGRLGGLARELGDSIAGTLALVEAGIDFSDQEDVVPIAPGILVRRLVPPRDHVDRVLDRSVGSEQLDAIPRVVLTGVPNAGKSTLFNALLGHTRAVVSEVAGTTRDVLTEPLTIDTPDGTAEVMLVDLAGSAAAESSLDEQMQSVAGQAIAGADLLLHCVPAGARADTPPVPPDNEILVRTKCDLAQARGGGGVCALTGGGLDRLRDIIAEHLADRAVSLAADALALRPRHEAALRSARRNLQDAIDLVEPAGCARILPQPELVAASLRLALDDLAALAGDISPDDVLGRIFSTFCVGK